MYVMRPPNTGWVTGLQKFVADLPDKFIMAEIGSYAGESTTIFAQRASRIYAIDPWVNYVEKNPTQMVSMQDLPEAEAAFDKVLARFPSIIIKVRGYSADVVKDVPDKSLDVVYIDGNHEYKHVIEDVNIWTPKIKVGGVIAGHDYADNIYHDVKRAINEMFGKPDKVYDDMSWAKWLRTS